MNGGWWYIVSGNCGPSTIASWIAVGAIAVILFLCAYAIFCAWRADVEHEKEARKKSGMIRRV